MNSVDILLLLLGIVIVVRLVRRRPLDSLPPGPEGLPLIGSALDVPRTHQWLTFATWSEKWGDIMSFTMLGQPFVILNSPQHALDMLEKKSAIYSSRAPIPVAGDMIGWSEAMILQPYGPRMRELRKLFSQVMGNTKRVERFQHLVEEETMRFLINLGERTDSLVHDIKKLTGSIIVMIAYGYRSSGDDDVIIKTVDKAMEDFSEVSRPGVFMADIFPILRHVPEWFPGAGWKKGVKEQRKTFLEMVELPYKWVRGQMAVGTALPSFASALLEGDHDAEQEYFIKMASASLYAGVTVSSITSFFLAMTCYPEVQRKAQAEIDTVIGQERLPSIADKDLLPYCYALMLEILRWLPVAPMGFPHQLIEDDFHASYFLPKGTLVMVNIWKILHDPALYSDPTTFNPDRFISSPGKEAERDPREFAFGFGRRKCPGIFFAEASIFAAITQTLAVYNILRPVDTNGNPVQPSVEVTDTLISHPAPFQCKIAVRSERAQALLDSIHL
ncbi:cytochrome P450 [Dichomitus squalens]|uniref:Cytochrome P450 n=1 Tax=Dichomitus squalens TaxID=114155 RepID=A0A4Q9MVI7_9APHY|nr:cytochrome P450 [Dichomitus squalens]